MRPIITVTLNPSLDEWIYIPRLKIGQLNRASDMIRYPGGKGINVSRVIKELGGRGLALAIVGGEDGRILRGLMKHLDLPHAFIEVSQATRNNYKVQTETPRRLTEINTPGPRVSQEVLRKMEQQLLQSSQQSNGVVCSGSLPQGMPPGIYRRWISKLKSRGVPVFLDTSGEALREGLAARPWAIKPNRQEAEELLGRRLDSMKARAQALRELLRKGPSIVILSMGKEGALLASRDLDGVWMARPPDVPVDSAVGAGDSLVAGFMMGWAKKASLLEALRLGIACGSATAMTPGTELCHRADIRRLLPQVKIVRLN